MCLTYDIYYRSMRLVVLIESKAGGWKCRNQKISLFIQPALDLGVLERKSIFRVRVSPTLIMMSALIGKRPKKWFKNQGKWAYRLLWLTTKSSLGSTRLESTNYWQNKPNSFRFLRLSENGIHFYAGMTIRGVHRLPKTCSHRSTHPCRSRPDRESNEPMLVKKWVCQGW